MSAKLLEFIKKIPKSDLHVHLDGSVRVETLIELSKKHKLQLPSLTVEGLNELVFKDNYANLVEYLAGFAFILPVMQTAEDIERISYEFAVDNINEGVCYVEVKFAPHLHVNENLDIDQVLLSVNKGLNRAKEEYNKKPEVKSGQVPEFNYGMIVCAMRFFCKGFSKFFDKFLEAHQYSDMNSVFGMASYELALACVIARDKHNIPVVAIDLVGAEDGNPPIYHKDAYHVAHQYLMNTVVHAGEAYGPESIYQAITELFPDRIGHGYELFSPDRIKDQNIQNKKRFVDQLVQYIAAKRITIEVCLTSNSQTIPSAKIIKDHSFEKMLENNLSAVICTDNRTFSKTSMTKELMLAVQNFHLNKNQLEDLILNGVKKSFYFGNFSEKKKYVEKVLSYYRSLQQQYIDVLPTK